MPAETTREGGQTVHRIPSLDGLRALSIFLVVALHSLQRLDIRSPFAFLLVSSVLQCSSKARHKCATGLGEQDFLLRGKRSYGSHFAWPLYFNNMLSLATERMPCKV